MVKSPTPGNSSGVDITKIVSSTAKNNAPTSGLTAAKNERPTKILAKKKDEYKLWTANDEPSTTQIASKKDNKRKKAHINQQNCDNHKPPVPQLHIKQKSGDSHKPPVPQLFISKDHRRKKKESKDNVVVLGRNSKSSVVLQKKTKNNGNQSAKATKKDSSGGASVVQLKQQLFEAQRDLGKEKNTREMLENKVTSLSNELKVIREKLGGEDKHYCISSLKEELEFEQNLRIKCNEDLTQANIVVVEEQKKVRVLEKEVESQKRANDAIKSELQEAKKELESKMILQQPLQNELSEEKQKTRDLQKRLQYEAAASIALRMELQAIKGRSNRVAEQLEEKLRVERSKDRTSDVDMKRELQSANEKLQRLQLEKKASHELHPQSTDKNADSEKDQLIRKLRKELHEVRERLKSERKKMTPAHQPIRKKQQQHKLSLSDWVDVAPTTSAQRSAQHPGLIPILQSPPRNATRSLPRSVETSLPGSYSLTSTPSSPPTADSCAASSRPPATSALSSLFHFEEDDVSVAHDKDIEPLHDELTFLRSAYDSDEIVFEGNNKVTHILELTTGFDSDSIISIAITVLIPNGYPASGVLDVKASIQGANCSHGVRKCAVDARPKLEEICLWEAKANEGREAIHSVFSIASGWANTDWHNILAKERSLSIDSTFEENSGSFEICAALIHTHHIVEAERIQFIKKSASKLSLGGFIKIGKPGFVLVEGNEEDCGQLVETLSQCKKIFYTSSVKLAGKVVKKVSGVDYDGCLPHKIEELEGKSGLDKLCSHCEELGLLQELNDLLGH